MLINAELLLQYQRCQRRPFLDTYGDIDQRDRTNELLLKVQQDRAAHQMSVLSDLTYHQPDYPPRNWQAGAAATLELMQRGVEYIHKGVLLTTYSEVYTLLSCPDLLVRQSGTSDVGNWIYAPVNIELGKRPKQEYQVVAAFHAQVLATVQGVAPGSAWLILRHKQSSYQVDLGKWTPHTQLILAEYIQVLQLTSEPEVFISRQKCHLCHWYSYCYGIAQSQQHLSLIPGVTPGRYSQLQALSITTLADLASTSPATLANLPGFDGDVAPKLILQAQSALERQPFVLPSAPLRDKITFTAPIELYFDIESQPDLDLHYLLGVLVVNRLTNTEEFYPLLAEKPEEAELIWRQFLDLVCQYPEAPIYHFCVYEFDTVKQLAKLYHTPYSVVNPILTRFVDVYAQLTQSVTLPVESYALKTIARWLGFEWREKQASGAKCIYWYDQWLETGDRSLLECIQSYNEDDCRATRKVKDWLVNFFQNQL